ncbi:MAG: SGNH/GDSL hydrolase family protein [Clostridia bacterium]|nr:SGNH/GDSL hydrolase family protein [Clostridia bacterium]
MKKLRILFQGDSITDAGRDKRNYFDLSKAGYPKFAAEHIRADFPDVEFEFINLGISGNRSGQLFDRSTADIIDIQPDVVSIMIGINDIWHRYKKTGAVPTTDAQFELNYRCLLTEIRKRTNAKIMIISPYLLDCDDKQPMRSDLDRLIPIVESLAKEFADVYMPTDALFAKVLPDQPEPLYYSADGVHPNPNGAAFIGEKYAEYIKPLLETL